MTANLQFVVETFDRGSRRIKGSELSTLQSNDYLHVWIQKDDISKLISEDVVTINNLEAPKNYASRKTSGQLVKLTVEGYDVGINDGVFQISTDTGIKQITGSELVDLEEGEYLSVCVPYSPGRFNDLLTDKVYLVATNPVDNITYCVSGDKVVLNTPLGFIYRVSITGEQNPSKSSTHTYTASIEGGVDPNTLVYEWSSNKGRIDGNGNSIDITWLNSGGDTLICEVSSADAVDSPVTSNYPIDISTNSIGSLSLLGPTTPEIFETVTYSVTHTGNATDIEYIWEASQAGEFVSLTDDTIEIRWIRNGIHSLRCELYSDSSNDSPRLISKVITAGEGLGVGIPEITGEETPTRGIPETYTLTLTDGETADNVYSWYTYNGRLVSSGFNKAVVQWNNIGPGTVGCLVRSISATHDSSVSAVLAVVTQKDGTINLDKGSIVRVDGNTTDPISNNVDVKVEDFEYSNTISPVNISYQWYRNDTPIGVGGRYYTIKTADVGQNITCKFTVTDAVETASISTDPVVPEAHVVSLNQGRIVGSPSVNVQLFLAGVSLDGAIGDVTYSYQWRHVGDSSVIGTASTYVVLSDSIGKQIECTIRGTDSEGVYDEGTTAPTDVISDVSLIVTAGRIVGNLKVDVEVTTTESSVSGGTAPYAFAYKWFSVSSDESDVREVGTDRKYVITLDDDSRKLICEVIVTDVNGVVGSDFTDYSEIVNTTTITCIPGSIIGTPKVGETLTTTGSSYSGGTGLVTFSYEWYAELDVIGTEQEYLIPFEYLNYKLRCLITVTDSLGLTDSKFTSYTGTILPLEFEITSFDSIIQVDDDTIQAGAFTHINMLGTGSPSENYKFYTKNNRVLQDSSSETYIIRPEDRGEEIRVILTLTEPSIDNPVVPRTANSQSDLTYIEPKDFILTPGYIDPNQPTAVEETSTITGTSITSGQVATFKYDWYMEGDTNALELNTISFIPPGKSIGKRLRVLVTATVGGLQKQEYTDYSDVVLPYSVSFTKEGVLSHQTPPVVGNSISITSDTFVTPYPPSTKSWQWENNDGDVLGTDSTYVPTNADVGKTIRCVRTSTDQYGISASYATGYTPAIEVGQAYIQSWGGWTDRYPYFSAPTTYNLSTIRGGDGNHTHSIDYRYHSMINQICISHVGGVGMSGATCRAMVNVDTNLSPRLITLNHNQSVTFRIHHRGSTGRSVYGRSSSQNSAVYYQTSVYGFLIPFTAIFHDEFNFVEYKVRNDSTGNEAYDNIGLRNGSTTRHFATPASSGNHTDITFHNMGHYEAGPGTGLGRLTLQVGKVSYLVWTSHWTSSSNLYSGHQYRYSAPASLGSDASQDGQVGTEKFTQSTSHTGPVPEGVAYMTANEIINTSSGPLDASQRTATGFGGTSATRANIVAQMEHYRLGRVHQSVDTSSYDLGITYENGLPVSNQKNTNIIAPFDTSIIVPDTQNKIRQPY